MQTPDHVEAILARLMPPGLSEAGQRDIETMLDDLATDAPLPVSSTNPPSPRRAWWISGIAATGIFAAWLIPNGQSTSKLPLAQTLTEPVSNVVLVGQSDRIESMTNAGWHEESDGSTMQALHLDVMEEESILDEETGMLIQFRQPREEILLMPVSSF